MTYTDMHIKDIRYIIKGLKFMQLKSQKEERVQATFLKNQIDNEKDK